MPPKKKCRVGNPDAQPGVGRRYLNKKFSALPSASTDLKKGHVLRLYLEAGNSRTETERQLKVHFSLEDYSFRSSVNSGIKMLVNQTLNKLKKLTNSKEFEMFSAICDERFDLIEARVAVEPEFPVPESLEPPVNTNPVNTAPDYAVPSTSTSTFDDVPVVDLIKPFEPSVKSTVEHKDSDTTTSTPDSHLPLHSNPGSSAHSRSRRGDPLTPRKAKIKQRLDFVTATSSAMKQMYKKKVRELRGRQKMPQRCINQAIQRQKDRVEKKSTEIRKLRDMLYGNALYIELEKKRSDIKKLRDTHRILIQLKRKDQETVSVVKYDRLHRKMKEKDTVIGELQHENLLLQETVEDLSSKSNTDTSTEHHEGPKVDGKTYSSAMRMKVYDCITNKVPTANIPVILQKIAKRDGIDLENIPQRSTVELMARELGAIAELQAAETILANNNVTVGFNATTQEGTHVN